MPEEAAPPSEDTPENPSTPAAPEAGTPAESQDSQFDADKYVPIERYNELRGEFDRRNPGYKLVEALQNPDTQEQAFQQIADELGYSVEELEDELEDLENESPAQDPRVDQLIAEREAEQQERYLDELETWVDGEIDKLAKAGGIDLTDDEKDLVFSALTPGNAGDPDVESAFKKVTGLRDAAVASYRKSKKAPSVELGAAGTEKVNLADTDSRVNLMASMIEADRDS